MPTEPRLTWFIGQSLRSRRRTISGLPCAGIVNPAPTTRNAGAWQHTTRCPPATEPRTGWFIERNSRFRYQFRHAPIADPECCFADRGDTCVRAGDGRSARVASAAGTIRPPAAHSPNGMRRRDAAHATVGQPTVLPPRQAQHRVRPAPGNPLPNSTASRSASARATAPSPPPQPAMPENVPDTASITPIAPPPPAGSPPPPPVSRQGRDHGGADNQSGLRLTFAPGQSDLSPDSGASIKQLTELRRQATRRRSTCSAYAPGKPDDPSTARRISLSRAMAVRSALVADGVPSARIFVRALGEQYGDGPPDRVDVSVTGANAPADSGATHDDPPLRLPDPHAGVPGGGGYRRWRCCRRC